MSSDHKVALTGDEFDPKALTVLRLLGKETGLSPRQVSDLSGLSLADAQLVATYLLKRNLVTKTSDGFSGLLCITASGVAALHP